MMPYGTPPPYVMYPPGGIYAHPSVPPGSLPFSPYAMPSTNVEVSVAPPGGVEVDGKSHDGKEGSPLKSSKGSLGSLNMITGKNNNDAGKTSGASANGGFSKSGESGSEASSEGCDTNSQNIPRPSTPEPDFLVQVPCQCEDIGNGTVAYFHDTKYLVRPGDTSDAVTTKVFSGLAWNVDDGLQLQAGQVITIHLPCGCYNEGNERIVEVVTYAVQQGDTLHTISDQMSSDEGEIQKMNTGLKNPQFLAPGWVIFVPMRTATPGEPKLPGLLRLMIWAQNQLDEKASDPHISNLSTATVKDPA